MNETRGFPSPLHNGFGLIKKLEKEFGVGKEGVLSADVAALQKQQDIKH
jgi:hypothetical protein